MMEPTTEIIVVEPESAPNNLHLKFDKLTIDILQKIEGYNVEIRVGEKGVNFNTSKLLTETKSINWKVVKEALKHLLN